MPMSAINYQNTIIYKLVCRDINIKDCYVGHTTNFNKRKQNHKQRCNKLSYAKSQFFVYKFIREHGSFENWNMIEIEKYPCNDKLEATKRERFWIERLKASLNKVIPGRTKKEYVIDTKEKKIEYDRLYREKNKESIREKKREYRLKNLSRLKEKSRLNYWKRKECKNNDYNLITNEEEIN
jgi:hypothetical protein